jgi:hypothetical protein
MWRTSFTAVARILSRRAKAAVPGDFIATAWVRALAQPYLRGYRAVAERNGSLHGFWFFHPASSRARKSLSAAAAAGFFVGYLVEPKCFDYLKPAPPECLIFAFVEPVGKELHRRVVISPDSLVRKTSTYIRWLTHRPPHFVFFEDQRIALVRHFSMRDWPGEKYEHFSRNFFIETLAWLVRSGLVRKLLAEPLAASRPTRRRKKIA